MQLKETLMVVLGLALVKLTLLLALRFALLKVTRVWAPGLRDQWLFFLFFIF